MKLLARIVFAFAILGLAPMVRADDPSLHEVYQAIHSGRLNEAQTMMTKVLHDHPDSAKAHYMEAEVLVRMNRADEAQIELDHADRIAPGLPFATADAQRSLRGLIAERSHARPAGVERSAAPVADVAPGASPGGSVPWGPILILGGLGLLVFLFLRARRQAAVGAMPGAPGMAGPPGAPYGGGTYGGAPYPAPGIGSGIMGGLATGAALGAGMVAGEAIAHEFIGNREHGGGDAASGGGQRLAADDGGGTDFGVSGADSWDSGSSDIGDSGGGGGDWG